MDEAIKPFMELYKHVKAGAFKKGELLVVDVEYLTELCEAYLREQDDLK